MINFGVTPMLARIATAVMVAVAACCALPTGVQAQCNGQFAAGAICGNPTGTQGVPRGAALSAFGIPALSATNTWTGFNAFSAGLSSTFVTTPNVYGGGSPGSTLTLQSTANGSPSSDVLALTGSRIFFQNFPGARPFYDFFNNFDGSSMDIRAIVKRSNGSQTIAAIINPGFSINTVGAEVGDIDFLVCGTVGIANADCNGLGGGMALQAGLAITGAVAGLGDGGFIPFTDNNYILGWPSQRFKDLQVVTGTFGGNVTISGLLNVVGELDATGFIMGSGYVHTAANENWNLGHIGGRAGIAAVTDGFGGFLPGSIDASTLFLNANSGGVVSIPTATASTSTTTGALTVGGGVGVAGTVSAVKAVLTPAASTLTQAISTVQDAAGTSAIPVNLNLFLINSDAVDAGANFVNGFTFIHGMGGSTVKGGRQAIQVLGSLNAPTNAANTNRFYVGAVLGMQAQSSDGGGSGTERGFVIGLNPYVLLTAAGQFFQEASVSEFNTSLQTGSSALDKYGVKIVQVSIDTVAGSRNDAASLYDNQTGAVGWGTLIQIGTGLGGSHANPLKTTGTVMATKGAQTIAKGIDFTSATFTGNAFSSPGFAVSSAGAITGSFPAGSLTGLGTGVATWLATPSSANLAAAVTDETGTGALVFANTPTLVTPILGTATGTKITLTNNASTTGNGGIGITVTQTQPNTTDTADSALLLASTLTANSASNELIQRVLKFDWTNTLTGGGAITNARLLNFSHNTSASTTTTNLEHIYIESGTASGTVTTSYGLHIGTMQGTTKWGVADDTSSNWYNNGYIRTGSTTVGALGTCNTAARGARWFVTDANATFTAGIGAVVAAGGANNVPVTCDGAAWRIGANDNIPQNKQRMYG